MGHLYFTQITLNDLNIFIFPLFNKETLTLEKYSIWDTIVSHMNNHGDNDP